MEFLSRFHQNWRISRYLSVFQDFGFCCKPTLWHSSLLHIQKALFCFQTKIDHDSVSGISKRNNLPFLRVSFTFGNNSCILKQKSTSLSFICVVSHLETTFAFLNNRQNLFYSLESPSYLETIIGSLNKSQFSFFFFGVSFTFKNYYCILNKNQFPLSSLESTSHTKMTIAFSSKSEFSFFLWSLLHIWKQLLHFEQK